MGESVALVRALGRTWATGLVNGVLRGFLRRRDEIIAALDETPEGRLAHPPWLAEATREAWPDAWERILDANNAHPPLSLRVNTLRTSRDAYLETLKAADIPGGARSPTPTPACACSAPGT